MEFIDKKDTGKEPQPIDIGFLHYMAAGMSTPDIMKLPQEQLIKVGNEYLEKEKSAFRAFEKLLKKYSGMKENIKPENRLKLSDLLDENNSYGEGEPKELVDLAPEEEFTFNGRTYTFIKLVPKHANTADVRDEDGLELRITFGGGRVNTGEKSGTGMADMGLGKGHHIDEEEETERDEELIAKLTPKRQYIDEAYYETSDLENTIITLGYDGFEEFFNDNDGAVEAVDQYITSQKAFREVLGRVDDEDLYEDYDADAEQDDEDVPNPIDDDGKPLGEDRSSARAKLDNARIAFKKDPSEENRNILDKARDYLVKVMGTDKPLSEEENSLNEAPNFQIIDKCLADYRAWARKQAPDSQELYDTTQAFIKVLQRLG